MNFQNLYSIYQLLESCVLVFSSLSILTAVGSSVFLEVIIRLLLISRRIRISLFNINISIFFIIFITSLPRSRIRTIGIRIFILLSIDCMLLVIILSHLILVFLSVFLNLVAYVRHSFISDIVRIVVI